MGDHGPLPTETERLLEGARGGSDTALNALFALHRERLAVGLRRRFRLEGGGLEEVVQETLMRAYPAIDDFDYRGQGSFLAWLFTRATREWQRLQRHELAEKRDRRRHVPLPERGSALPRDPHTSPSAAARREELRTRVFEMIERLPAREREALNLRRFLDLDYEAIQGELRLPSAAAARALVSRAQVRLAELLQLEGTGG